MTAGFKALADLIASFPTLSSHSHFIFVPGPTDPWTSTTLPRPPIPSHFVQSIINKVPKATFTTNPARIKYFDQEIVIFREDLMGRMLRSLVQIKQGVDGANMKRFVSDFFVLEIKRGVCPGCSKVGSVYAARPVDSRPDASDATSHSNSPYHLGMGSFSPAIPHALHRKYHTP